MDRPTLRIRADLTGQGEYVIVDADGTEHDISNLVNASVIKTEPGNINSAVIRLIGFSLDINVEGDLEVEGPKPAPAEPGAES